MRLELQRLTVLVGRNGSGKSNVADAFQFLADCMSKGLPAAITKRHGIGRVRRWSRGHPYDLTFGVDLDGDAWRGSYHFELAGDATDEYRVKRELAEIGPKDQSEGPGHSFEVQGGSWKDGPIDLRPKADPASLALPLVAGDERFHPLAEALRTMARYSVFPDVLRMPQSYDPTFPMEEHGANWVSVLRDQEEWRGELLAALGELTGDIKDMRVTQGGGFLVPEFLHGTGSEGGNGKRKKWFSSFQQSDGTLRFAGIVSALLQRPVPTLVAIEEPELTLHPGAIPLLVDFIQQATETTQVVLTTQSPEILDVVDPDAVRVVERIGGETTVRPVARSQMREVKEGLFTLGEIQRTEGLQQELFDE